MVWTAAATTAYFTNQIGLIPATWQALQNEGITQVDSLGDFDEDQFETIVHNFRRPPAGQPVVPLSASSVNRLIYASHLVRYYQCVGRNTSAANMAWDPVVKTFKLQYKSLMEKKKKDDPEVPKVSSRSLPVMMWSQSFEDYLAQIIGKQNAPLSYVIRAEEAVPHPCPDAAPTKVHAGIYDLIEHELIARASHAHVLFHEDNETVYFKIEEAVRGTSYAPSIKPFTRAKNGRGAFLALTSQHAGEDKWNDAIKTAENTINNVRWRGNGSYVLEKFCSQHRNAHTKMVEAALHVTYQVPDETTRVRHLLEHIDTSDAQLQAAIASIRQNADVYGPRNDFEKAVALILPADPVARKKTSMGNKRPNGEISGVDGEAGGANVSSLNIKSGKGKSGVEFRFYQGSEYNKLSPAQKDELRKWRATEEGKKAVSEAKKSKPNGKKGVSKAMVAAALKDTLIEMAKEEKDQEDKDIQLEASIEAVLTKMSRGGVAKVPIAQGGKVGNASADEDKIPPSRLLNILGRVRNASSFT